VLIQVMLRAIAEHDSQYFKKDARGGANFGSSRKHHSLRGLAEDQENIMKLHWMAFGAALAGLWSAPALAADSGPVKIALIADKTGPLEAYAKQTSAGFAMGLAYATGGTMEVAGRKLVAIEKDSQTKPDVGCAIGGRS
jgi:ABC-type branched-subunit amino acid transport system substrate-binding protein